MSRNVVITLSQDEAALLEPLLERLAQVAPDLPSRQLAAFVACSLAKQVRDIGERRKAALRRVSVPMRVCPMHDSPLRVEASSLGTMTRVYYCTKRGCDYTLEEAD